MMFEQQLHDELTHLKQQGLHRQRKVIRGDDWTNFSSNDYLNLSQDERIKKAFIDGFTHYPTGSGGSATVCGYYPIHQELEQAFCQLFGVDNALLFSSGYAANLSLIAFLASNNCELMIDKGCHASLYDGIRLSKATYTRFIHNDLSDLKKKLMESTKNSVIATEGLFSMSGQTPDFHQLMLLCETHAASLIVDEAHAFGVIGQQGLGSSFGLPKEHVPLRIIPFGKSLSSQGAIILGKEVWIDSLLQTARSHIYSTAISPALAYGVLKTLEIVVQADEKRQQLSGIIDYFNQKKKHSSLQWRKSYSPIQQLQLGCPHKALRLSKQLAERKLLCLPMRSPTVNLKETGLRVVLTTSHDENKIDELFNSLEYLVGLL